MRSGNNEHLQLYKTYKNKITQLIRKTKDSYYRDQALESGKDMKKLWNTVGVLTNKKSRLSKIMSLKSGGKVINSKISVATELNKYFTFIADNFLRLKSRDVSKNVNITTKNITDNNKSIFMKPVSEIEISNYIGEVKISTASGPDGITPKMLKVTSHYISNLLRT